MLYLESTDLHRKVMLFSSELWNCYLKSQKQYRYHVNTYLQYVTAFFGNNVRFLNNTKNVLSLKPRKDMKGVDHKFLMKPEHYFDESPQHIVYEHTPDTGMFFCVI